MKVAIAGAGKLGMSLTDVINGGGHDVTLIDSSDEAVQKAQNVFDVMVVRGDAKRADMLKSLSIESYDLFIAATDEDEKNIFICALAKKLGCPTVIARVRDPEHVGQMELIRETFGCDYIVNPDLACANEIYKFLTEKDGVPGGSFRVGGAEVLTFVAKRIPGLAGSLVRDISVLPEGALITAVSRNGKIIIPNGNTALCEEDVLYVICPGSGVDSLRRLLRGGGRNDRLKRVMIAGGGKTSFYLAKRLSENGVSVKIIELNRSRCEYLAGELEHALVIHGSASDSQLLADESLSAMDGFAALTGTDETNVLLAMLARQYSVKNVVAKMSHNDFRQLAGRLDDTMTVNPVEMCVAEILRWIDKGESVLFTQLIQGQAEIIEVLAEEDTPLTEKTLSALNIPEGVLIATVNRKGNIIIPSGSTKIEPGDRVVIFSMLTSTGALESLINRAKVHTV